MPDAKPRRCCGTCAHWSAFDAGLEYRQCEWPEPTQLPFWAGIHRGSDHDDSTSAEQGTDCATWVPA